jgi:WXG100 family type VII secretion target
VPGQSFPQATAPQRYWNRLSGTVEDSQLKYWILIRSVKNMVNISVSYSDMTGAADRLIAGREDINSRLAQLQSLIEGLVSQGFVTDKSSGAFRNSYAQFTNGARNAIQGLDGLSGYLRTSAQTLADVDSQLAARLSS